MDKPRKRTWNQAEWAIARKRAINSKDAVCAICHKWIDLTLPMNTKEGLRNPLAVEIDHIVPRSRGGDMYDLENLQLTHMRCNRKKGARMDSDYKPGTKIPQVPLSNPW